MQKRKEIAEVTIMDSAAIYKHADNYGSLIQSKDRHMRLS